MNSAFLAEEVLTPIQVRVLACLIEKQATTPDQYPLTVNALRSACNQKTARSPVMNVTEGEVGAALLALQARDLAKQAWSSRAARWEHCLDKVSGMLPKAMAVIATLMLRGPQTAAEVRQHCHRLFEFPEVDDCEYTLHRLMELEPALVILLPRQPGQKGERYMHLMAGEPDMEAMAAAMPSMAVTATSANAELEQRVADLEALVADLVDRVEALGGD